MSSGYNIPLVTSICDISPDVFSMSRSEQVGLVTVLCRSPISLCHLGLECERAYAAQI